MAGNSTQEQTSTTSNSGAHGLSATSWIAIAAAIAVVVIGFGAWWTYGLDRDSTPMGGGQMEGMATSQDVPRFPPVGAYYDGERVFFAHTETSDPQTSDMLTGMMNSPVITVPELAQTPEQLLGSVYVFTNGITPDGPRGPLGFQPDIFDSAPGDPDYTPLRQLTKVTWTDEAEPQVLTSTDQIDQAVDIGELTIQRTTVVVNAPLLTWPGGQR